MPSRTSDHSDTRVSRPTITRNRFNRGDLGHRSARTADIRGITQYDAAVQQPDHQSVTHILAGFAAGDRAAVEALLPKVYNELRRLAAAHVREDRPGHTLQPTALVHEAYVRMVDGVAEGEGLEVTGRSHFFRLASKVMRQILVDHARARDALKRGGGAARLTLDAAHGAETEPPIDLLSLEDALARLERLSPRKAQLVELRFFGGLSEEQAAEAIGISRTQAAREWRTARAWLADELGEGSLGSEGKPTGAES